MTTLTTTLKKIAVTPNPAALQQQIALLLPGELVKCMQTMTIWQQRSLLTQMTLAQRAMVFRLLAPSRRYDIARSMDCSALAALLSTMGSTERASMYRLLPTKQQCQLHQQRVTQ